MKIQLRPGAKKTGSKSPTTASRKALAGAGQAMPGGRYPIPNVDFLKRAVRSIGRTPPGQRPAVVAWIKKRASALGQPKLAANLSNAADAALELANRQDAIELAGALTGGGDVVPQGKIKTGSGAVKVPVQSKVKGTTLKTKEGKVAYAKLRAQGYPPAMCKKAAMLHEQGLVSGEWSNTGTEAVELAFKPFTKKTATAAPAGDTPGSKDADGDSDNDSSANVKAKAKLGLQNHQALQAYAKSRKKGLPHSVAIQAAKLVDRKLGNPKARAKQEMTSSPKA